MDNKETRFIPTISMQTTTCEDGTYGVSLMITGLQSKQQAEAALAHIEQVLCGQEIKAN